MRAYTELEGWNHVLVHMMSLTVGHSQVLPVPVQVLSTLGQCSDQLGSSNTTNHHSWEGARINPGLIPSDLRGGQTAAPGQDGGLHRSTDLT